MPTHGFAVQGGASKAKVAMARAFADHLKHGPDMVLLTGACWDVCAQDAASVVRAKRLRPQ